MKRVIYLLASILLGILLSFLVHAAIEIPVILLLIKDFNKYSLGLSWSNWILIHHLGSLVLFIFGVLVGYLLGRRWWRIIYLPHLIWIFKKS